METLPVETAVEWVTAWTGLSWPVSWETAFAIRDRLGWVPYSEDGRFFTTVLTPPGARHGGSMSRRQQGMFSGVTFPLATRVIRGQKEPDTASVTWAAYASYVEALTGLFGKPRTQVRQRGKDDEFREATWYLPNRASFSLTSLSGIMTVYINSPQSTLNDLEDQRLTEKYGEDWEDFVD
ncbi:MULTISPECIES: DUF6301 family protein [Actinomyces]|nr:MULTISPECIES: DUF6301 family protein [Actinomyces]